MSVEYIRQQTSDYFKTQFGTLAEVQYENHDTVDLSNRALPYVNFNIRYGTNEQITLGLPSLYRQRGAVQLDIYVKDGKGTSLANTLLDAASNIFKSVSVGQIEFFVPRVLDPIELKGWLRLTVRCPFYYDS